MTTFRAPDGARVEVITVALTAGRDGQWYRVTDRHGLYAGETRSIAGLVSLGIDIAALTESTA